MNGTLFGAAYYDEYMPYDRIDTDFELMKKAGMNVIRIAESTWSTWEPDDNYFDFSHLHRMLESAKRHDLCVIVGTPTYAIPSWLEKKHPDVMALTPSGQSIYGHRQIHDITNPNFLFYAERIIRKLMEEVSDNPQIIGYQIDNETRSGDGYSPANQKLFVEELKKKYPDIKEFNEEFGLSYWSNSINSWEDLPDIRGTINGSLSAAYKAWLRDRITKYQIWQSDIIRQYISPDQFITHNYDFSWIGYSHGIQPLVNQRDAAMAVDIAGVDIYHRTQNHFDGSTISFGGSVGRSMKKDNYLVLETQSQGRLDWLAYPGQLRQAYYSHLASGANGVMYWNWHSIHNSFESYWKGILSHSLIPGRTYKELSDTRNEELHIDKHLVNLKKNCPVAILVDNRSLVGLDEFPIDDVSDSSLLNNDNSKLDYNSILRWMYDACYKLNIETDIIYKEDILEADADELVNKYPLIIIPALYSSKENVIHKIRAFVEHGGHLLICFKSFFADEELKIYSDNAPHLMTDIIGGTYDEFTRPVDTTITIDGQRLNVSHWMELLNAEPDTEIWANYDHKYWGDYAAVLHKKHASGGSATYLGCYLEEKGLSCILRKIVLAAKIPLSKCTFPIIIKKGVNPLGEDITYLFNYSDEKKLIDLLSIGIASDTNELLSQKKIKLDESIEIEPWGVKIFCSHQRTNDNKK